MDILRQVGENLRRLRRLHDLSQEAVALEAEVARSYMSALERGKRNPTLQLLERLAWALDTTVIDLISPPEEEKRTAQRTAKPKRKSAKPGRRNK